jgi:CubicO group peptidase (beta-lactamase class C family)
VHGGRIVAERYGEGIDRDTQLESWSMGKSITAALIGLLVRDGHFGLDDPAPVDEWQRPGDPRSRITMADLMRMSSGLEFSLWEDPGEWVEKGFPDHVLVYTGAVDAFRFSITRPAEFPPGTVGRYRNCDPLTLGYLIRETVRARGEEYLTFPQRALFDRIGIRKQVLETDAYGNFLLTGFDYGTARNWARLGMLFLQDGVWQGERILPEGFVDFVRTPAPAWEKPEYGGQFWVNGTGEWALPTDAYYMGGAGGQHVFIVPSHDLVIVRMGHQRGGLTFRTNLLAAQGKLLEAVEKGVGAPF